MLGDKLINETNLSRVEWCDPEGTHHEKTFPRTDEPGFNELFSVPKRHADLRRVLLCL